MYVMIVAERNKPVAFEVLVLPGFPNTYTVQSTGLNQGLLFSLHSACFRIEWVLGGVSPSDTNLLSEKWGFK